MRQQSLGMLILLSFITEPNRWSVNVAQPLVANVLAVKGIRIVRNGGRVNVNRICTVEDLESDR